MYTDLVPVCFDYTNCFQDYQGCLLSPQALLSMLLFCFLLLYFNYRIPLSSYHHLAASFFCLRSYSYKPLDVGRKEIRLIKLQASIKLLPLCGNVIHVPWSADLQYWALSYCWGSLARKRTIILDGKKLRITANLDDALRQLGNSYGLLWVDAICINQEDIPERSREVLRMGDIYSRASGVAAWLGVASKTSDRAMDFLQVLATKTPRSQYDEYLEELPSENDPGKFVAEWTALKDLAMNGYWSRTWIIQELSCCRRSKIVHCGTKSLPWVYFKNIFFPSGNIECPIDAHKCIVHVVFDVQELLEVGAGIQNLGVLSAFLNPDFRFFIDVCDLLSLSSGFLATDPRDKVYGILGMSDELSALVPHTNYANSKGVVFRDLTKALLGAKYKLDLICLKSPTDINQSDDVSWVPNFDVHGLWIQSPEWLVQAIRWEILDIDNTSAYSADAGKDAVISYVGDGSILRVRGYFFDRVDGLGSTITHGHNFGSLERRIRYNAIQPSHRQNAYGSDVDTFKALKQFSQEIFRAPRFSEFKVARNGYSLNNECLISRLYRQRDLMDHNSVKTKIILQWLQQAEEFNFVDKSIQQWYEMAYIHGQALPLESSSLVVQKDPELGGMLETIERVKFDGWRWLSTDRGFLGRTHAQTQKGDEIVIVQGCSVPMVLRPCGEHYNVVGAAYVQGIMNGEALQGVPDDEMRYFDLA
ncbi:hypothetical protein KC19_2G162600 [Ceratodon purpureus]|uniref:Heterokaryon incompatibility domain-containing protein n=1 Tax=Ceratodon purpureus TaxID=3225 RepID=A0A8T0IXA5_CERPU|nr:hypothetical protein KC19_2G162600 [Ceratodon purpureus]